jgi:hypothetical protein
MSGPIVRTGTTPKFWENWDRVFGGKKKQAAAPKTTKSSAKKSTKTTRKANKK